jgi:MYXO-CTERM domain-containing protein
MRSPALIAVVSALVPAGFACATVTSVFYTVDQAAWTSYSTNQGASISSETFSTVGDGYYVSGVSGIVGGISWTATASGGISALSGLVSASTGTATLEFAVSPGVNGIAGNLFGRDSSWAAVPAIIMVTLSDSTTYIGYANGPSDFIGFYSTGATISSLSVTVSSTGSGTAYATADNLYFATVSTAPAPGALALLGVAGLASRRRRRGA